MCYAFLGSLTLKIKLSILSEFWTKKLRYRTFSNKIEREMIQAQISIMVIQNISWVTHLQVANLIYLDHSCQIPLKDWFQDKHPFCNHKMGLELQVSSSVWKAIPCIILLGRVQQDWSSLFVFTNVTIVKKPVWHTKLK